MSRRKPKNGAGRAVDAAGRKGALAFDREQKRRERERRKEEAPQEKRRMQRQRAVDKARSALANAEREHDERKAAIEAEREAIEKRSQAEDACWDREKAKLEAALRRAKE